MSRFKLVIEGIDGHEPLTCPVSYEFDSEEEAIEAESKANGAGLTAFLITPVVMKG